MSVMLQHTMFQDVFFPEASDQEGDDYGLQLKRLLFFKPLPMTILETTPIVVFDFETTGLDSQSDRIIEVGGLKTLKGKVIEEFHSLIKPDIPMSAQAESITGITTDMLQDAPPIEPILKNFLKFIEGSFLVAHNAEFDWAFLKNASDRIGFQLSWPCFCTLKMARQLLPELESKNLDSLAKHYGLQFEARHRSIGDCRVTFQVLKAFLRDAETPLETWQDLSPYACGL